MDLACFAKEVTGLKPRFADRLDGRRQLAVARLVTTPERPYVVLSHSKFPGHGSRSTAPVKRVLADKGRIHSSAITHKNRNL